jgi:hypothetical protein
MGGPQERSNHHRPLQATEETQRERVGHALAFPLKRFWLAGHYQNEPFAKTDKAARKQGGKAMPNITSIQPPTAQKLAGNQWRLSVTYTATFSAFEVANFNFRDAIQVWEDDPFDDDRLTGWRNDANFNPGAASVVRTKTTTVSGDTLDTELGGEEIFMKIRLFNVDLNTPPVVKSSSNINLAP